MYQDVQNHQIPTNQKMIHSHHQLAVEGRDGRGGSVAAQGRLLLIAPQPGRVALQVILVLFEDAEVGGGGGKFKLVCCGGGRHRGERGQGRVYQ